MPPNVGNPLRSDPLADADEAAVSEQLSALIRSTIQANGPIAFSDYMQLCLYHPSLGYYRNGSAKFGREGDFVTAPEMSGDFARCVARQCLQVLQQLGGGSILEFGAGSGRLAADILSQLQQQQALPRHYFMLEVSGELRQRQKQTIGELPDAARQCVQWLDALPEKFDGVVLANELFDAMPVERFKMIDGRPQQVCVTHTDESFAFALRDDEALSAHVATIAADLGRALADDYESEYCDYFQPWWQALGETLQRGAALVCDYGSERKSLYTENRTDGSLRCFYRHSVSGNPFVHVGMQDITADVDFTALTEAALLAGFELEGYAPLASFLLQLGLLEEFEQRFDKLDVADQIVAGGNIKKLTLADEMGERFRVIGFSKSLSEPLTGFVRVDHSHLL